MITHSCSKKCWRTAAGVETFEITLSADERVSAHAAGRRTVLSPKVSVVLLSIQRGHDRVTLIWPVICYGGTWSLWEVVAPAPERFEFQYGTEGSRYLFDLSGTSSKRQQPFRQHLHHQCFLAAETGTEAAASVWIGLYGVLASRDFWVVLSLMAWNHLSLFSCPETPPQLKGVV